MKKTDDGTIDERGTSRRDFLFESAAGLGSVWLAASWPEVLAAKEHAHQAARAAQSAQAAPILEFFSPEEASEVEAMIAQIIPRDGASPGAKEAGGIYFIDRALTTFDRGRQALYGQGLKDLQAKAGGANFSALSSDRQIEVLKGIENTQFFAVVREHTIVGFLAEPSHGGNQDKAGWKMLGFDDAFQFKPPFGYYDKR